MTLSSLAFSRAWASTPLDLQLHFAEADVGADADLHQIAHLCHDRHLCPQIVDLDVDFVDLDDGDVEQDVRPVGKLMRIDDRVVGKLSPRAGTLRRRRPSVAVSGS